MWIELYNGTYNRFGLEIDRKDPSLGYVLSNMTWACHRCNLVKTEHLTYEEMLEIGQKYIRPKWENVSTERE
jgi:hypothetical protein